jgi:hypothetical protein
MTDWTDTSAPTQYPNVLPCGCLRTSTGAHRGDGSSSGPCPDYETVYPPNGGTRLDDLTWRRRDGR